MVIEQNYNEATKIKKCDMSAKNVAFLVTNNYVKYLSVNLVQLSRNTSFPIELILLHDGIKEKNFKKLKCLCEKLKFHLNLVSIKNTSLRVTNSSEGYWCKTVNNKVLLISDFFKNIGTIVYLDVDISIVGNVDDLFNITDHPFSAVIEVASITKKALEWEIPDRIIPKYITGEIPSAKITLEKYFNFINVKNYTNSGVLVINPDFCQVKIPFSDTLNFIYSDQDYLNKNFDKNTNILDYKWNMSASFLYEENGILNRNNFISKLEYEKFMRSTEDMRIIHYAGYIKPWETNGSSEKVWDSKWHDALSQCNFKTSLMFSKNIAKISNMIRSIVNKFSKKE